MKKMTAFSKTENNHYQISSPFSSLSIGTAARASNTIDYNREPGPVRKDEKSLLSSITGLPEENILFLNQVHDDGVLIINSPDRDNNIFSGDADAIVTCEPGLCPVIRTADCVPVFIYDDIKKVLGAAHSGWKGTRLKISGKMATIMNEEFKCSYSDMNAYILPSIGPESYIVNEDVAKFFEEKHVLRNNSIILNLWSSIEDSLMELGIPGKNIFNSGICNLINKEHFFSHRAGDPGRNLNFGFLSN